MRQIFPTFYVARVRRRFLSAARAEYQPLATVQDKTLTCSECKCGNEFWYENRPDNKEERWGHSSHTTSLFYNKISKNSRNSQLSIPTAQHMLQNDELMALLCSVCIYI
jgi:hypothetical protein